MAVWVMLEPVVDGFIPRVVAFVVIMFVADRDRPGLHTWTVWITTGAGIAGGFYGITANVLLLRMLSGTL